MESMWLFLLSWLLPLLAAEKHVHNAAFTPDHILRITVANISVNCETRTSVVINGTSPGPKLALKRGKPVWIRVYNDMPDLKATIHWHGITQRSAPFSDGAPQVSQWPIPPAHFFDYEVFPDAHGTFYYHSHVGFQAISAFGPLIVKPCGKEAHQYDEEMVLSLGDYYNKTDKEVTDGLIANPFVWPGETAALLLNGHSGTSLQKGGNTTCAPLVITVKPNTKYRLRFIGSTAISLVALSIESHASLTIIEADGSDSKAHDVDHLQIASGQRFSAILHTKSEAQLQALKKTVFWIRYENRERPANVSGYAILQYDVPGATPLPIEIPPRSPVNVTQDVNDWLEYALEPLYPSLDPMPGKANRTVIITTHQNGTFSGGKFLSKLEWTQNDTIWQPDRVKTPYLVDFYLNGAAAVPNYDAAIKNGGWDPKTLTFAARVGEVIDIVWQNNNWPTGGYDIHPLHAHGVHYYDLGSGNGTYNATFHAAKLSGYTPIKRDTTMLYRYASTGRMNATNGWRAWRLEADEPGVFMLHCHILQHQVMGMSTIWVIGQLADLKKHWPEPPYIDGYLKDNGSAYGNMMFNPTVNHYFGQEMRNGACVK